MATIVIAKDGDTLCGIGLRSGFLDCTALRAEAANAGLLSRALVAGDRVTVPSVRSRTASAATATTHTYVRPRWPEPVIRLVHGSPSLPAHRDASLAHLGISNYHTKQAGTTGLAPFTSAYGFDADADADPDTFKVEVLSPDGGGSIKVTLEALKPVYAPDGSVSKHELFTGAAYSARRLEADCQLVQGSTRRYRSRYLRLVVDETETAALPDQTLLVTDMADGLNGDADRVEILDQRIRASYPLPRCPVAGADRCTVRCEIPIGKDPQRIRMAIHVYRDASGVPVGGLTEQMVRKRVGKWFRRLYAQANMSVKLDGPQVQFLDPPPADMITISQNSGALASGVSGAGTPSSIRFELATPPGAASLPVHTVTISLVAGQTPTAVGNAIRAALPVDYSAKITTNAPAFSASNGSCDVIIDHTSGIPVMIQAEKCDDSRLTVDVPRIGLSAVNSQYPGYPNIVANSLEFRRIIRGAESLDSRLDVYVVGGFSSSTLLGRAFLPYSALNARFQPTPGLRWALVLRADTMNASDQYPTVLAHEAGHILLDAYHADPSDANSSTELMWNTASATMSVSIERRIQDSPVTVKYQILDPRQPTVGAVKVQAITPVDRLSTNASAALEGW